MSWFDSVANSPAFVIHQAERLVSSVIDFGNVDGPAYHESELILPQLRNCELERSFGIKGIVPKELKHCTVQVIAAALAYDVDLVRAEAILRGIRFALDFEFLDRVLRQNHRRGVQGRVRVH